MKDKKAKLIVDALCGIIMLTCIMTYLILGFVINWWHPGWLIIVCGAFVTAIMSIITNLVLDLKKTDNENKDIYQK